MATILVTGASGFIGRRLCSELASREYFLRGVIRRPSNFLFGRSCELIEINDIGKKTDWSKQLMGVSAIVHLAARAHLMLDKVSNPLQAYREVNTFGTETLAKAAVKAGVKRFIYISSIKVNGENTNLVANSSEKKFSESDIPNPADPYAVSKWEAEQLLLGLGRTTGLEVVIIRPPLVFGPHVKANFLRLLNFAERGIPLPLGSVHNRRSLVSVYNFVDLIIKCIDHPKAKGETFLVSDGCDISTPDLIAEISKAMHKKSQIFPFPVSLLKLAGLVTGKLPEVNRLCSSLQVDISKANTLLNWTPPVSFEEGIKRTVEWYQNQR